MARIKSRLHIKAKPTKKSLLKPEKNNNHEQNIMICFVM